MLGTCWRWSRSWHIAAEDKSGQLQLRLTGIDVPAAGHWELLYTGTAFAAKLSLPSGSVETPNFLIHLFQISKMIQRLQVLCNVDRHELPSHHLDASNPWPTREN